MTFINSGEQPLRWDEVATGPVNIELKGGGEILAAEIQNDDDVQKVVPVHMTRLSKKVQVAVAFLNPQESFTIVILHSGGEDAMHIAKRMSGQNALTLARVPAPESTDHSLQFLLVCGVALIAAMFFLRRISIDESPWLAAVGAVFVGAFAVDMPLLVVPMLRFIIARFTNPDRCWGAVTAIYLIMVGLLVYLHFRTPDGRKILLRLALKAEPRTYHAASLLDTSLVPGEMEQHALRGMPRDDKPPGPD